MTIETNGSDGSSSDEKTPAEDVQAKATDDPLAEARAAIDPLHEAAIKQFNPKAMRSKAFAIGLVPLLVALFYIIAITEPPSGLTEEPPSAAMLMWQAMLGVWNDLAVFLSFADAQPSPPPNEVGEHRNYQADMLFGAAILVYAFLVCVTLLGQIRAVQRFGEVYWPRDPGAKDADGTDRVSYNLKPRKSPLHPEIPTLIAYVAKYSGISLVVYQLAPFGLPWVPIPTILPFTPLCDWSSLATFCQGLTAADHWRDYLVMAIHALFIGTTSAVIAVTSYGAFLISRMYPTAATVADVYHRMEVSYPAAAKLLAGSNLNDKVPEKLKKDDRDYKAADLVTMADLIWRHADITVGDQGKPDKNGGNGTDMVMPLSQKSQADREERRRRAPTNTSLSATGTAEVVTSLCRALLILLIVALVVLYLGFDAVEQRLTGPDVYKQAVAASNNAWLLAFGVGFSLALALVYYIPMVRLNLFIYSEADRKKPAKEKPTSWTGKIGGALWKGAEFDLKPEEKKKQAKAKIDPDMTFYIGADHAKLTTILDSDRFLGAYHAMLEKGLPEQVQTLLVLLAPTFFSGILSLLG